MPFEHVTAPATFMRLINIVFCGMLSNTCFALIFDIIILECTFEEHLKRLDEVFSRFKKALYKI